MTTSQRDPAVPEHVNIVQLRGRLAAAAQRRELPSGDLLCVFRLVVERPAGTRGRIDTVDCASTGARVRRIVERADAGEVLEIHGQLRRRFWRGAGGPTSRYEVEVGSVSRLLTAGRRSAASPARTRASA